MKRSWFDDRKDVFLRNLVSGFVEAKTFFDAILKNFKKTAHVPYDTMDRWLGSERSKGPLWQLKDLSHKLFRDNDDLSNPYENLFDWCLGSLFHEAIKLKEDAYKIDSYKPLLEEFLKHQGENSDISTVIYEHFSLIEETSREIEREINNIDMLFTKAINYLYILFPFKKDNPLLLRFILDRRQTLESVFGKSSMQTLLNEMFPEDPSAPYRMVSEYCRAGGWREEAEKYLKKAKRLQSNNKRSKKLKQQL